MSFYHKIICQIYQENILWIVKIIFDLFYFDDNIFHNEGIAWRTPRSPIPDRYKVVKMSL